MKESPTATSKPKAKRVQVKPFFRLVDKDTKRAIACTEIEEDVKPLIEKYSPLYVLYVDCFEPFIYEDEFCGKIVAMAHYCEEKIYA